VINRLAWAGPEGQSVVFQGLFAGEVRGRKSTAFQLLSLALIVVNLGALYLEAKFGPHHPSAATLAAFAQGSLIFFAVEFGLALFSCTRNPDMKNRPLLGSARLRFLASPAALLDLLSFAPSLLFGVSADLRVLKAHRLIRPFLPGRTVHEAFTDFQRAHFGETLRQKIYILMVPRSDMEPLQRMVERSLMVLIFVSVLTVILESVASLRDFQPEFLFLEALFVGIFTVEYLARLYCCVEDPAIKNGHFRRLRGMMEPGQIVDLLAILPFYLSFFLPQHFDLRFLRAFRLIRALKLVRYSRASRTLMKVLQAEWPVVAAAIFIMFILVILTASLGYLFEHEAQPDKFENIPQSIYWAVITLASVGYGDISPLTSEGRLVTVLAALVGIGIFALPAAILSSAFIDQMHQDRETLQEMLAEAIVDGQISEEERHQILQDAEELSLSDQEVHNAIDRELARQARERRASRALLSAWPEWSAQPDRALEQFRGAVSWLHQVQLHPECAAAVEAALARDGEATERERAVWRALR